MPKRLLITVAALVALFALPSLAGATVAYTTSVTLKSSANLPIMIANDDGTGARAIGQSGLYPMISPDGKMIAYTYISNAKTYTQELRFVNIATGVMVDTNMACTGPKWAPNSSAVACSMTSASKSGLITGMGIDVVTPSGAATIILPSVGVATNGYDWSPDSSTIVWGQTSLDAKPTTSVLRWLKADGSGAVGKLGKGGAPVWGPSKIAFTRSTNAVADGGQWLHTQIWTVDPAVGASSATQLTSYRAKNLVEGPVPFQWTSDGTRIVGTITGEDYSQPVYISATTGRIRDFGPFNAEPQAVSADGTQALVLTNLLGGTKQPVYVAPLAKMSSELFLKDAGSISVTANWNP